MLALREMSENLPRQKETVLEKGNCTTTTDKITTRHQLSSAVHIFVLTMDEMTMQGKEVQNDHLCSFRLFSIHLLKIDCLQVQAKKQIFFLTFVTRKLIFMHIKTHFSKLKKRKFST